MSITYDILKELWETELNYKGTRVNIFGIPISKKHKKGSFSASVNRLKNNSLIKKDESGWFITTEGKQFLKNNKRFKNFTSPFPDKSPKNLLIIFDVPQDRRAERDWLRWQLRKFGYLMIQRSVWVGPSPLPLEFKKYIQDIKLKDCIKTFKLEKGYIFNH
ncbi:MAG TPA: CRISPR-associated endonuclease Cas2 [Candidatus Paceibacterota bacterium]|nr:CRISPR-associated endonuclease Cas2 [Candidatus Paceibacterota bacterium]